MNIKFENNKIYIKNPKNFDLAETLDCGQCFRWSKDQNGIWSGIAFDKYIELYEKDGDIIIKGSNQTDFENIWFDYFDLRRFDIFEGETRDEQKINEFGHKFGQWQKNEQGIEVRHCLNCGYTETDKTAFLRKEKRRKQKRPLHSAVGIQRTRKIPWYHLYLPLSHDNGLRVQTHPCRYNGRTRLTYTIKMTFSQRLTE